MQSVDFSGRPEPQGPPLSNRPLGPQTAVPQKCLQRHPQQLLWGPVQVLWSLQWQKILKILTLNHRKWRRHPQPNHKILQSSDQIRKIHLLLHVLIKVTNTCLQIPAQDL